MSTTGGPQSDPQTHLDTDPVNNPADDRDEEEGRESEGDVAPGPATDT